MKTYMFIYKIAFVILSIMLSLSTRAQTDTTKTLQRLAIDSNRQKLNMDAVYNRPFLSVGKLPVALGGYLEANTQYQVTDGVSDGFSFQARRLTLFMSSTIARKIKFLSEIEFEDGTKEINIEFAAMDIEFHPMLNFRGGIIMNPIGAFNQNHDGPRWDFIDRPFVATAIIPTTLASAGFGIHGKHFANNWVLGYETYLTNGFDDHIISNTDGRTSLAAGKINPLRFEESNSGLPMFTGKFAVRNRKIGEAGISYMTGVYNKWKLDDIKIDNKRHASVLAFDFNTSIFKNRLSLMGELAKVWVVVPDAYTQQYGQQQLGIYLDAIYTVLQRKISDWDNAKLNAGLRIEYADFNQGTFNENGKNIGDHVWAIVPAIAFRPVGSTVLRFNYRFEQQTDLLGNPPANTAAFQFGFSTYF